MATAFIIKLTETEQINRVRKFREIECIRLLECVSGRIGQIIPYPPLIIVVFPQWKELQLRKKYPFTTCQIIQFCFIKKKGAAYCQSSKRLNRRSKFCISSRTYASGNCIYRGKTCRSARTAKLN